MQICNTLSEAVASRELDDASMTVATQREEASATRPRLQIYRTSKLPMWCRSLSAPHAFQEAETFRVMATVAGLAIAAAHREKAGPRRERSSNSTRAPSWRREIGAEAAAG